MDNQRLFLASGQNSEIYAIYGTKDCLPRALKVIYHDQTPPDRNFASQVSDLKIKHETSNNKQLVNHLRECMLLHNEKQILNHLDEHPNIINCQQFNQTELFCSLQYELAISDYREFLNKNLKFTKLKTLKLHFKQIAEALHFLHKNGIAHNDITLDNILYFGNQIVKLTDFGHSRLVNQVNDQNQEQLYNNWCRKSWYYLSPELVELKKYQSSQQKISEKSSDIFAFGVCIFLAAFSTFPFQIVEEREQDLIFNHLVNKDYEQFWQFFSVKVQVENKQNRFGIDIQDNQLLQLQVIQPKKYIFKDLLQNLLNPIAERRFNSVQMLLHPFFLDN